MTFERTFRPDSGNIIPKSFDKRCILSFDNCSPWVTIPIEPQTPHWKFILGRPNIWVDLRTKSSPALDAE